MWLPLELKSFGGRNSKFIFFHSERRLSHSKEEVDQEIEEMDLEEEVQPTTKLLQRRGLLCLFFPMLIGVSRLARLPVTGRPLLVLHTLMQTREEFCPRWDSKAPEPAAPGPWVGHSHPSRQQWEPPTSVIKASQPATNSCNTHNHS